MDAGNGRRTLVETLPAEELTRLLGQLGHEVGTPLGSVLMMAEMLADVPADPALRRRAEGLKQAATEVRTVVQAFVRLVRLRTGWLSPTPNDVSGDAILRSIRTAAESAGLEVTTPAPGSGAAEPRLDGHLDLDYLHDAVDCVCAWVKKCSPGARMEVSVDTVADIRRIRCTIHCSGCDVPWNEAAILDPIGEGDLVAARRHGDSGLHLALAAALVWRLGGALTGRLDSSVEGGENVLRLELPARADDPLKS